MSSKSLLSAALIAALALGVYLGFKNMPGQTHTQTATLAEDANAQAVTFELLDGNYRSFDGSPALALTFSRLLSAKDNFEPYIRVFEMPPRTKDENTPEQIKEREKEAERYGNDSELNTSAKVSKEEDDTELDGGKAVPGAWILGDTKRSLFFPHIKPNTRYLVQVMPGLSNAQGGNLGKETRYSILTAAVPPAMNFASKGMVLPAKNGGLPISTVNIPEVDVQFLRVKPEQLSNFLDGVIGKAKPKKEDSTTRADEGDEEEYDYDPWKMEAKGSVYAYSLDRLHRLTESVYSARFVTESKPNKRSVTFLPVEDIKELKTPGIYVAVMTQPNRFKTEFEATYFYVSDLGLHLRQFEKQADAFVSSLSEGTGVSGVEVNWLDGQGKILATATSDSNGRAHFDAQPTEARMIMAKKGEHVSMITLREPALDLSEFPITGNNYKPTRLFAYSGRDLYRPGEQFDVSVLARDADGQAVPPQPIQVTLKRPDGKEEWRDTWKPSAEFPGYFKQPVKLSLDAPTGAWSLEFRNDPADRTPAATMRLSVEEFLPERMQLSLKAPEKLKNSTSFFDLDVSGHYLYGSPAAGNTLIGAVNYKPEFEALKDTLPGFIFGDMSQADVHERRELEKTELDDKGKARLNVSLEPIEKRTAPFKVSATVSLLETGGRPVIRTLHRTVWPAEAMVGVRPLFESFTTKSYSPAEFEIVYANPKGQLLANKALQIRLFQESRDYYWRYDDHKGWNTNFTENSDLAYIGQVSTPANGRTKINLPVQYGRYYLEVSDPESNQTTRLRFYAGWSARSDEEQAGRPDRVAIKLDKAAYTEGDTAKVTLTPPHDGQALVTVEGDQVLWSKRIAVSTQGTELSIPIDTTWKRHDLYINVMSLRPAGSKDRVTPTRALGLAHLPLLRENRKLDVQVSAPERMRPDQPLKVKVNAPQLKNQKAMVTINAVDVGILNITEFVTPNPFDFFFGKLRYGGDLHDIYGRIIERMAGQKGKLRFGGDSAPNPNRSLPKKVKLVDLFSGPVALNAEGQAEVDLQVPDFNGKLRLMAVVAGPNQFASKDLEVTVAAPLVVELAAPRFINHGDSAIVALDVQNLSGQDETLNVRVESAGLKFGTPERKLTLKNEEKQTLRFPIETGGSFGLNAVTILVEGKAAKVTRDFVLQVQAPTPYQTVRRIANLAPNESLQLNEQEISTLLKASVQGSLEMSSMPPLNLPQHIKGLVTYPYGCTEQTVSSTYPHLFIDGETAKQYKLKPFSQEQRADFVAQSLAKLSGRQAPNGGFSSWGSVSNYEYWLTAYVANFMLDARDAGFKIPDDMLQKSLNFLLKGLQEGVATLPQKSIPKRQDSLFQDMQYAGEGRFGVLTYGAYVLARENKAPLSSLRQLLESKDHAYSGLSLVQLGIALKLMGDEPKSAQAIESGLNTKRKAGYWWGDYGSEVRDLALSIYLLDRHKLQVSKAQNLLPELIGYVKEDDYLSTQEKLAVFLAAHKLGASAGNDWQMSMTSAGETRKFAGKTSQFEEISPALLAKGITLTNTGDKSLYVSASLKGNALKMPSADKSNVVLSRKLYRADGKPVGDRRSFKVGESLIVGLTVAPKQSAVNLLVVDAIPAGFEIENLNLKQSEGLDALEIDGKNPLEEMASRYISHTEFRDDRFVAILNTHSKASFNLYYRVRVVTPGRFVFPPVYAEDMYRPKINSRSGDSETVEISD